MSPFSRSHLGLGLLVGVVLGWELTYVSGRKGRPVVNVTAGMHWMRMESRHPQNLPALEVQNVMR